MRILITGGCGFIGSNFVRHFLNSHPESEVTVLDLLTYAGNLANLADLADNPRLVFIKGDIADRTAVEAALRSGFEVVVNFAAESHVDRSILDAAPFIHTNVVGTQVLLEIALECEVPRFVQISTDEVYGSLGPSGKFTEDSPLRPNSPYSASKAAADLLVRAYARTHDLPAIILRSSNAFGPYQFPEKLIPLMISNALAERPLPVYGDGLNVRDWIYVDDLCEAIAAVLLGGVLGEVYNVGGAGEETNIAVVEQILTLTQAPRSLIRFVEDRPGHDRRYAMDFSKLSDALGWQPKWSFGEALRATVDWYEGNAAWVESIRGGEYLEYYDKQYSARVR